MLKSETEIITQIDEDGNEKKTIKEKTTNIQRNGEPDYIKLYTRMWCEFNNIPDTYRSLFLELATRMSYCNSGDINSSQLVNTGKPWGDSIMASLQWKKAMFQRGLRALCECNAIKKVGRGVYQINPSYAGRGEWKYNPQLQRGGVEDLVTTFSFRDKKVETTILWGNDGQPGKLNDAYRAGLGVKTGDNVTLKTIRKTPKTPKAETVPDLTPDLTPIPELTF